VEASVSVWRELITLTVPVGAGGGFLLAPFQVAYVTTVVGVNLTLRCRPAIGLTALALPAGVLLLSTLECARVAVAPLAFGSAWAIVAALWAAFRTGRFTPQRKVALVVCMAVGAGGALLGSAGAQALHTRLVLRDVIEPPFDPKDYPSPLAGYRHYVKDLREVPLARAQGLPVGGTIRLAAMDSFDGTVWNVSGSEASASGEFHRIGTVVDTEDAVSASAPGERQWNVHIAALHAEGVWLPVVDGLAGIEFADPNAVGLSEQVRYNAATGTAVFPRGVPSQLEYTVAAASRPPPDREALAKAKAADVVLPEPQSVPDVVRVAAGQYAAEAATAGQMAMALEQGLREDGFFSHGQVNEAVGGYPSLAGHGADRVSAFLTTTPMVGDAEQYASTMALMARSLGLPARVVLGFAPFAEDRTDTRTTDSETAEFLTLTGDNIEAWVEICFDRLGWVAFFPTPNQDKTPREQTQDQRPEPQPQIVQPPIEDRRPAEPDEADREAADTRPQEPPPLPEPEPSRSPWLAVAAACAVLLFAFGPPGAIWLAKSLRTHRRAHRGSPLRRIQNGWTEFIDTAKDSRIALPRHATRREIVAAISPAHPDIAPALALLANHADYAEFSFQSPQHQTAEWYWGTLRQTLHSLRTRQTQRQRLTARIATQSLRRRKPHP
jgi:transglutaminase-like putative cysteine protease